MPQPPRTYGLPGHSCSPSPEIVNTPNYKPFILRRKRRLDPPSLRVALASCFGRLLPGKTPSYALRSQGEQQAVRHKFEGLKKCGEERWYALSAGLEIAWKELTA